jgi:ribonuclease BN (tRNA processing enzyme)
VKLTILGCSGSVPGPDAPAPCYLVEADGFRLVLDLGNGALAALQARMSAFDIDALAFSHLHPDHCADFSALAVLRRYHPQPPYRPDERRLAVYGPAQAPGRFAAAYAPNEGERLTTDFSDVFDFHPLACQTSQIGPFTVTSAPVTHPCEAYGFRIEHDGKSLAYSGDTAPCAALDQLAAGVDLLLAEATWTDLPTRPADMHMSGRQAGQTARRAGVGRLMLTHIAPWTDPRVVLAEARDEFDGAVLLAEQGAEYEI